MSDTDPSERTDAFVAGRLIEVVGWLVCVLAVALLVLAIVHGGMPTGGAIALVLFVAAAGGAVIGIGRGIGRSRVRR